MTRVEANAVLDAAKAGLLVSVPLINAALHVTGDLFDIKSVSLVDEDDHVIQIRVPVGQWERTKVNLSRPAGVFDGLMQ